MMIHRSKEPYRSSNIYRVTASLTPEFKNLNPFEKLEAARKVVFNFDYPTPDSISSDEFKRFFEHMFISRFWERWFKAETFESFTIQLYSKMLEVLPTYNIVLSKIFDNDIDNFLLTQDNTTTTIKNKSTSKGTTSEQGTTKAVGSAFPSNIINAGDNVGAVKYANNGNLNENNTSGTTENNTTNDGETVTTRISGNLFDQFIKYNTEFKDVFTNLINEFNILFSFIIC